MSDLPTADNTLDPNVETSQFDLFVEKMIKAAEMLVKPAQAFSAENAFEQTDTLDENPLLNYEEQVLDDLKSVMQEEGVLSEGFGHVLHRIQLQLKGEHPQHSAVTISEQHAILTTIEALSNKAKSIDSQRIDLTAKTLSDSVLHTMKDLGTIKLSAHVDTTAAGVAAAANAINARVPAGNNGILNNGAVANNGAPNANNGAPAVNNGAPAVNNGAPAVNNGAPAVNNGAPAVNNGAPAVNNGAPAVNNGAPGVPVADDATLPVFGPEPKPQGWLGWAADHANPINWFGWNKPAATTPSTPAVTDETVDHAAIGDLLNQVGVTDEPKAELTAPVADTTVATSTPAITDAASNTEVTPAPQQGWLGWTADILNPINYFPGRSNQAAPSTPVADEEVDVDAIKDLMGQLEIADDTATPALTAPNDDATKPVATTPAVTDEVVDHGAIGDLLNQVGVTDEPKAELTAPVADTTVATSTPAITDAASNTEVTPAPQQGWLGWTADILNPINYFPGRSNQAAPSTPVADEEVDVDAIKDLMGQLEIADDTATPALTTPNDDATKPVATTPAVTDEVVDHGAIGDLLNQVGVVADEPKAELMAPVAETTVATTAPAITDAASNTEVTPAPQQGWLGWTADILNPINYFPGRSNQAAPSTPVADEEVNFDDIKDLIGQLEIADDTVTPALTAPNDDAAKQPANTIIAADNAAKPASSTLVVTDEVVNHDEIGDLLNQVGVVADEPKDKPVAPIADTTVATTTPAITDAEVTPAPQQGWLGWTADILNPINYFPGRTNQAAPSTPVADEEVNFDDIKDLMGQLEIADDTVTPALTAPNDDAAKQPANTIIAADDAAKPASSTLVVTDEVVNHDEIGDLLNQVGVVADEPKAELTAPVADTTVATSTPAITDAASNTEVTPAPQQGWLGWTADILNPINYFPGRSNQAAPSTPVADEEVDVDAIKDLMGQLVAAETATPALTTPNDDATKPVATTPAVTDEVVDHAAIGDLLNQVGVSDEPKAELTAPVAETTVATSTPAITDAASNTEVTPAPQQGWLGWTADILNPINYFPGRTNQAAPSTPVADEEVNFDDIKDLIGQLEIADDTATPALTAPNDDATKPVATTPAVTDEVVDHAAIGDLLNQVGVVADEPKAELTAPVAETTVATSTPAITDAASNTEATPAPQQGLLGRAADLVSPGYWFSWNKPAASVATVTTVDESLKDVSPASTASPLTQSVLSIARGEPSTLSTKGAAVQLTSDEDFDNSDYAELMTYFKTLPDGSVDEDAIAELMGLVNSTDSNSKQIEASVATAVSEDDDSVDLSKINELLDMVNTDQSIIAPASLDLFAASPLASDESVNHDTIADLMADFEVASDEDAQIDADLLDEMMSGLVVAQDETIHASDVLSDMPSVLDRLTDIGGRVDSEETFGAPLVSTAMKAAQYNLRVATEKYQLANANKLARDSDVVDAQARIKAADAALEEAKEHAEKCRSITNNGKLAATMDFFTPSATNYQPAKLLAWAEGKKAAAHAYCEQKIAELSKQLFKDSKIHTLEEIKPILVQEISGTETLLKHKQGQFEPLKQAYEDLQSKAWFGGKFSSYPEGYKAALDAMNSEQQKLSGLKEAQTEILALEKAVGAWDQLVAAHGEVVSANQHYVGCQAAQAQAIEQVASAKVPYESAVAEVAKLGASSHQAVDTHHADTTDSAMTAAPKTTVLEEHHTAAHSDF